MAFDIHPLVVHFPIALLVTYAVLECIRLKALRDADWYVGLKAFLVVAGELGALAALATGQLAQQAYRGTPLRTLVHVHQNYAAMTAWVFGALALVYLARLLERAHVPFTQSNAWSPARKLVFVILDTPLGILVALIGLVLVTITGALGGAIVYGASADPIISFVTHLLGVA